ncbi:hypothetical protein STEG23_019681, partial [Scotinomys teguina]
KSVPRTDLFLFSNEEEPRIGLLGKFILLACCLLFEMEALLGALSATCHHDTCCEGLFRLWSHTIKCRVPTRRYTRKPTLSVLTQDLMLGKTTLLTTLHLLKLTLFHDLIP